MNSLRAILRSRALPDLRAACAAVAAAQPALCLAQHLPPPPKGRTIVIDLLQTSLPKNLERRLSVVDFATPVQAIEAFRQGENTRIVIEPKGQWEDGA